MNGALEITVNDSIDITEVMAEAVQGIVSALDDIGAPAGDKIEDRIRALKNQMEREALASESAHAAMVAAQDDRARVSAYAEQLREALQAMVTMSDRGPKPQKLDEALTWRQNDERARALADAALAKNPINGSSGEPLGNRLGAPSNGPGAQRGATPADTSGASEPSTNMVHEIGVMSPARQLVELQALDEGLWFVAQTAPEAYLQRALRALHAAIEDAGYEPHGVDRSQGVAVKHLAAVVKAAHEYSDTAQFHEEDEKEFLDAGDKLDDALEAAQAFLDDVAESTPSQGTSK